MTLQTTRLNAESHLLLVRSEALILSSHISLMLTPPQDQPLLRLPHELLRKTFKTSQKHIERDSSFLINTLQDAANSSVSGTSTPEASLLSLDNMIGRMQGLKRKLESLHEEEKSVLEQSKKRIAHLQDLYGIPSLVDEGYDRWSKIRLDRLLVDSLLRSGYGESAKMLAQEKQIEVCQGGVGCAGGWLIGGGTQSLVDVDVFLQCAKIEASLRKGSTTECLAWCAENKNTLRKNKVRWSH